jgi:hypothetical protein
MSEEIWKPISGFSNYEISSLGRVKSLNYRNTSRIVIRNEMLDEKGYNRIGFINDLGELIHIRVHRLVGLTFIPNPENKPEIDHINHNRTDNRVVNLRWATRSEQMLNCNSKTPVSGHKYIHLTKYSNYCLLMRRSNINRTFKTLEEAITFRDETLRTVPHPGCS